MYTDTPFTPYKTILSSFPTSRLTDNYHGIANGAKLNYTLVIEMTSQAKISFLPYLLYLLEMYKAVIHGISHDLTRLVKGKGHKYALLHAFKNFEVFTV